MVNISVLNVKFKYPIRYFITISGEDIFVFDEEWNYISEIASFTTKACYMI